MLDRHPDELLAHSDSHVACGSEHDIWSAADLRAASFRSRQSDSSSSCQSAQLRCFEFVSAIVAHKTSDKNVALVYHTIGGATHPSHPSPFGRGGAVKHRSPLITLAAVALAFAIMFIVNMTASPPGNSSSGTANPPVVPATASAGNPQVTVDSGNHNAAPVTGDEGL